MKWLLLRASATSNQPRKSFIGSNNTLDTPLGEGTTLYPLTNEPFVPGGIDWSGGFR